MIRLKVKEVAEQHGLSMARLSRKADIDLRTLQRIYKNPTGEISTTTLDKIATALGVPASDLIETVADDE